MAAVATAATSAPNPTAATGPGTAGPEANGRGLGPLRVTYRSDRQPGRTPLGPASNLACSSCNPPLLFTPGAYVMGGQSATPGSATLTPVFWAPPGYSFDPGYKALVEQYLSDLAAEGSTTSNVFSVADEYYQQIGTGPTAPIVYRVSAGAEVDTADAFPVSGTVNGCQPSSGYSACVADPSLQAEIVHLLAVDHLPGDDAHLYLVLFPPGVETCSAYGAAPTDSCSTNTYCAYHGGAGTVAAPDLYANLPYPNLNGCSDPFDGPQAPNGNSFADAAVSLISHEANEAITDWDGAWVDAAGYEDGDECNFVYGSPLGVTSATRDAYAAGTSYNQVINGHRYWTQDEFSNTAFSRGIGDITAPAKQTVTVAGCLQRTGPSRGEFLLVDDNTPGTNQVSNYRVNPDGTTTLIGTYPTGHPGLVASWLAGRRADAAATTDRLYALNLGDQTVSVFSVNPSTGVLNLLQTTPPLSATAIAVNPAGTVLYTGGAANEGSADRLSSYALNADGTVSPTASASVATAVDSLAVSPDGTEIASAYPGTGAYPPAVSAWAAGTLGQLTAQSSVAAPCPTDVRFASASALFSAACENGAVSSFSLSGGQLLLTGSTPASALPSSTQTLALGPNGYVYFDTSSGIRGATTAGPATGPAAFALGPAATYSGGSVSSITVSPDGSDLMVTSFGSTHVDVFSVGPLVAGAGHTLTLLQQIPVPNGLVTVTAYSPV
ncbi:MAG: hypothetical protein KGQ66_23325 [Acidobacteriota bacterium]|nr:hypothetical protein [Acidobacteriota bacterium]